MGEDLTCLQPYGTEACQGAAENCGCPLPGVAVADGNRSAGCLVPPFCSPCYPYERWLEVVAAMYGLSRREMEKGEDQRKGGLGPSLKWQGVPRRCASFLFSFSFFISFSFFAILYVFSYFYFYVFLCIIGIGPRQVMGHDLDGF